MRLLLVRFCRKECGATAIEYALIAGILAIATSSAFSALDLGTHFSAIAERVTGALGAS